MAHSQIASLEKLLAVLQISSGTWQLTGRTAQGDGVTLAVEHSAEQSFIRLDGGRHGISNMSTAASPSLNDLARQLRSGINPSWSVVSNISRMLPSGLDNPDLWKWLGGVDISPTLLVIPGVSALRSKLPSLDFGAITLPECIASVSLRSISIDLHHGAVAATMILNDVVFDGDAKLLMGDGRAAIISHASLMFALDFTYSFVTKQGSIWLQTLVGRCEGASIKSVQVEMDNERSMTIEAKNVQLSARDVWYSLEPLGVVAKAGDICLECTSVTASASEIVLSSDVVVVNPMITAGTATISGHLGKSTAQEGMRVDAELRNLRIDFSELRMAPQADLKIFGIVSGVDGALLADHILINLGSGFLQGLSAGISVNYERAEYKKAGVAIEIQTDLNGGNILVLSAGQDTLSSQFGFRAKVTSAIFTSDDPSINVPLKNITLNYHRIEHQPKLPISHRTKTVTAISDIGFLITGFGFKVLDPTRVPINWAHLPDVFNAFGALKQISFSNALTWVSNAVGEPLKFLGEIGGLLSLGQLRIEDVSPFVNTTQIRIKFEPEWSSDQTIAFKVIGGIDGVGVQVRASYPCPEWNNWGKRCDKEIDPWTAIPKVEIELGLAVTLEIDVAAKRIHIQSINPFLPIDAPPEWKPIFQKLQGVVLAIFANIYGAGWVLKAVTDAIDAALPLKLPSQWDVSRLTVSRDHIIVNGQEVWGVQLGLRYEEHQFG